MLVLCSSSFAELLRRLEGCKVTTMVRDVQLLVVRFSEKSPACRVSFSHFALTTPAPAYHFALRNYVFFNGRARHFPVHLSKCWRFADFPYSKRPARPKTFRYGI